MPDWEEDNSILTRKENLTSIHVLNLLKEHFVSPIHLLPLMALTVSHSRNNANCIKLYIFIWHWRSPISSILSDWYLPVRSTSRRLEVRLLFPLLLPSSTTVPQFLCSSTLVTSFIYHHLLSLIFDNSGTHTLLGFSLCMSYKSYLVLVPATFWLLHILHWISLLVPLNLSLPCPPPLSYPLSGLSVYL